MTKEYYWWSPQLSSWGGTCLA